MFVDVAQVKVKAGDGGNGVVSFRHEKFIDRGGPDGGDGGNGGSIIFEASNSQNTLAQFRFQRELKAEPGQPGSKRRKHGRGGKDFTVAVPVGTTIVSEEGTLLADLTEAGQQVVIAKGGHGGFGNAHFVSSTRQTPRVAEKGEEGQELAVTLELKMIADVGLVGLPNAGKSTLLSVVSNARPEIANYPFTTLAPNLGVVDIGDQTSLLFADIPGLIEGASQGKGLGDEFLRHVERTLVLVHLIDIYQEDLVGAYQTIQAELQAYKTNLSERPQLVVLTKVEGLDEEMVKARQTELRTVLPKDAQLFTISSQSKQGIKELLFAVKQTSDEARMVLEAVQADDDARMPVLTISNQLSWQVAKTDNGYMVTGPKIEKFAARTEFSNYHGTQRLRDIMRKMGIMHELVRRGIEPGDKIHIGQYGSIEY